MKLGEILIHKGIINETQLAEALNAQLIYGGHLGTCLIEKGYIDELSLGQVLSEVFRLGYATPERFENIPQHVIQTLPQKLVEKHNVIPLALHQNRLEVAMMDPRDLIALDELRFVAGFKVVPWITPEIRIFQAMERYYGVPRKLRYVNLCDRLEQRRPSAPVTTMGGHYVPVSRDSATAGEYQVPAPRSATAVAENPSVAVAASAAGAAFAPAAETQSTAQADNRLEQLADQICRAPDEAELGRLVLDYASCSLERAILFRVSALSASYWDSRGFEARHLGDAVTFQVIAEPVFSLLLGESMFRGTIPPDPRYESFYATFGLARPAEALIIPVYQEDRLSALYYGDSGEALGLQASTEDHRRLSELLGKGLNLIELKRQIRAVCA